VKDVRERTDVSYDYYNLVKTILKLKLEETRTRSPYFKLFAAENLKSDQRYPLIVQRRTLPHDGNEQQPTY